MTFVLKDELTRIQQSLENELEQTTCNIDSGTITDGSDASCKTYGALGLSMILEGAEDHFADRNIQSRDELKADLLRIGDVMHQGYIETVERQFN